MWDDPYTANQHLRNTVAGLETIIAKGFHRPNGVMLKINRDVLERIYFEGHVKPTARFSDDDWQKVLKAFHQDQYLDNGDVELHSYL